MVAIFNLFSENFHDKAGLVSFPEVGPSVDPQGPRPFVFFPPVRPEEMQQIPHPVPVNMSLQCLT